MREFGWLALVAGLVAGVGAWFWYQAAYSLGLGPRADVVRRWVECRYVAAGRPPHELSRRILAEEVGPARALPERLHVIPRPTRPDTQALVIEPLGPPESTYPPSSVGLLVLAIGWLPTGETAAVWWLVVQAVTMLGLAWLLAGWLVPPVPVSRATNAAVILGLMALFTPFGANVRSAQLGAVAFLCLVVAARRSAPAWLSGAALAVGLVKPTTAIPFVLWELARGRWKPVAVAAGIHAALLTAVCWWTGAPPVGAHRDWMAVAEYFMSGTYSVQDAIQMLKLHGTPAAIALQMGVLAAIAAVCVIGRRAGWAAGCAFLCVANLVWVYHRSYDFVTLLFPLLLLLGWREARPAGEPPPPTRGWGGRLIGVACFALISAGLTLAVLTGDDGVDRVVRWGCRAAVVYVLLGAAARMCADGGVRWPLRRSG